MLHDSDPNTLPGLSLSDALDTLTPADADRFRILVEPDEFADDGPLQWGGVTAVALSGRGGFGSGSKVSGGDDPLNLARALERFEDGVHVPGNRYSNRDEAAAAAIRWAAVFHGVEVLEWQGQGYSQGNWATSLVYLEAPADFPDAHAGLVSTADTLGQWFRGDVYVVTLERLEDAETDTWEPLDSIGGVYLDDRWRRDVDAYTPAACAAEQFGVPRAFADALEVVTP